MKTRSMLSFALVVIAAIAVPAFASASEWKESGKVLTEPGLHWSKNGSSLKGESGSIELTGPFYTEGEFGGVECALTLNAILNPGSAGEITGGSLSTCKGRGALSGCKVTSANVVNQPSLHTGEAGGKRVITTATLTLAYTLEGFLCPKKYEVGGTLTATPDNSAAMGSLSLSGLWVDSLNAEEEVSGTLAVKPAGQYGILAKNTAKLAGEMFWESELGGFHCSINGTLELSAGSSGQVTSFNWSNCYGTGPMAYCKITSATSSSLPWSATDEGTTIKITGVSFSIKGEGKPCPPFSSATGEITATPNNTSAIASTTLVGVMNNISVPWYGSVNWTPAGIFGL